MPRNYGRVATSIWRDPAFRTLSPDARFTYLMLFSQPNISAAGVLELTERRWEGCLGFDSDRLRTALDELVDREYIVIDPDTQELLVRSFVKWDGGSNNDLRKKAIADAAGAIASYEIRASIAHELDRNQVPHGLSNGHREGVDTRRVVVTEGEIDPQPVSGNLEEGAVAAVAALPPAMYCSKHPDGTEEPCGPCGTARARYAEHAKTKLAGEVERRRAAEAARAAALLTEIAEARENATSRRSNESTVA